MYAKLLLYAVQQQPYFARPGPRFNINISSYQYRKCHCGGKIILRQSYLHNVISYTGETVPLYWIRDLVAKSTLSQTLLKPMLTSKILHFFYLFSYFFISIFRRVLWYVGAELCKRWFQVVMYCNIPCKAHLQHVLLFDFIAFNMYSPFFVLTQVSCQGQNGGKNYRR